MQLTTLPSHPCPYLPGREAQLRALMALRASDEGYLQLLQRGFRRSGRMIYQPACPGCHACVPLRVRVADFQASKSQRRCWRKNRTQWTVSVAAPVADDEKFALYCRYLSQRHGAIEQDRSEFEGFLYDSPVSCLEFCYRDSAGELVAVGICDEGSSWLSSVYFYFDSDRSGNGLGTYGALYELDYCLRTNRLEYYLGFWIEGCRTMQYKSNYRPHERMNLDGTWSRGV